MALKTQSEDQRLLEAPDNATRTSDYETAGEARAAYLAALDEAVDDLMIGLQIRVRDRPDADDQVELDDFIRQQGHDPADFEA
jgi:hypothetical protein